MLLTDSAPTDELGRAMGTRGLAGRLSADWDDTELRDLVHQLLTEFYLEHAPGEIEEMILRDLFGLDQFSRSWTFQP